MVGLTKTLAKEWGQFKINVNAVAFGFIETRLTAAKTDENVAEIGGERVQLGIPEQLRAMGPALIPLGRAGTPQEAAGGVFLLCTPWANYVNGQVLSITGGQFGGMTRSATGLWRWRHVYVNAIAKLRGRAALDTPHRLR